MRVRQIMSKTTTQAVTTECDNLTIQHESLPRVIPVTVVDSKIFYPKSFRRCWKGTLLRSGCKADTPNALGEFKPSLL
jgi:hypothetical protein